MIYFQFTKLVIVDFQVLGLGTTILLRAIGIRLFFKTVFVLFPRVLFLLEKGYSPNCHRSLQLKCVLPFWQVSKYLEFNEMSPQQVICKKLPYN